VVIQYGAVDRVRLIRGVGRIVERYVDGVVDVVAAGGEDGAWAISGSADTGAGGRGGSYSFSDGGRELGRGVCVAG